MRTYLTERIGLNEPISVATTCHCNLKYDRAYRPNYRGRKKKYLLFTFDQVYVNRNCATTFKYDW